MVQEICENTFVVSYGTSAIDQFKVHILCKFSIKLKINRYCYVPSFLCVEKFFISDVVVEGGARTCSGGSRIAVSEIARRGVSPPFDTNPGLLAGHFVCRLSRQGQEFSFKRKPKAELNQMRQEEEFQQLCSLFFPLPSLSRWKERKKYWDAAVVQNERRHNKRSTISLLMTDSY